MKIELEDPMGGGAVLYPNGAEDDSVFIRVSDGKNGEMLTAVNAKELLLAVKTIRKEMNG